MIVILLIGGFFRSLQFTSTNALAYAELPPERVSRATALSAVGQQLAIATGVAVGAFVVEMTVRAKGEAMIGADDFSAAFLVVAAISAASVLAFIMLPADAGAELASRTPLPVETKETPAE
jgi:MFS family permease